MVIEPVFFSNKGYVTYLLIRAPKFLCKVEGVYEQITGGCTMNFRMNIFRRGGVQKLLIYWHHVQGEVHKT